MYVFIMRGISTATGDSFFSADDEGVSAKQAGGNRVRRNVVRRKPCILYTSVVSSDWVRISSRDTEENYDKTQ
jgi:hypothetical protein